MSERGEAGIPPSSERGPSGPASPNSELVDQVVVVTGGGSGLGEAIAARAALDGARVVVADLDEPAAKRVADEARRVGGVAEPMIVDVTREGEVAAMVDAVVEEHGGLDGLVCSAAVEVRGGLLETTDTDWEHVLDVNLKGAFLCMKHAIPRMVRAGGGSVVLLGSVLGSIGQPGHAAYCASKGALVNLAKQAAIEHAADGVRVNVVAQMEVRVPDPEALDATVAARTPMGRLGTARDVTDAVVFLLGEASSYVSGAVLPVDGGLAARRL